MNNNSKWILISIREIGSSNSSFPIKLAAQRMVGWQPDGDSFMRLFHHGYAIPDEAVRVHGYAREILERDGNPPEEVFRDFVSYADSLPVVAYNLEYDWDKVLLPAWQRLGISQIGVPGFCALKLAQRLLDPMPAGNCKLQTLRQYYSLPETGAHTALGDVQTVVDLMQKVLRPLAEKRGLDSWEKIVSFTTGEWYPSLLPFGNFKGRLYQQAREGSEFRSWLEWLSESTNERSSAMGRWYLGQLANGSAPEDLAFLDLDIQENAGSTTTGLVVYRQPGLELYQRMVEAARDRLAHLELEYGIEISKVVAIRCKLFGALRMFYQERDRLRLLVNFRKAFIERLLAEGEDAANSTAIDYHREAAEKEREYESTAAGLEGKRQLGEEETVILKQLWKKLVRIFHPDLHEHDPDKRITYERLTQAINEARGRGDIGLLVLIAKDPAAFILKQGWASVSLDAAHGLKELRSLYDYLQARILEMIETLDELRGSAEMEIFRSAEKDESVIAEIVAAQREELEMEIAGLKSEAERVAGEARELAGNMPF
jgi:DNA polymerase III epsilon subunit-like protein